MKLSSTRPDTSFSSHHQIGISEYQSCAPLARCVLRQSASLHGAQFEVLILNNDLETKISPTQDGFSLPLAARGMSVGQFTQPSGLYVLTYYMEVISGVRVVAIRLHRALSKPSP